jgi:hypothetical protein
VYAEAIERDARRRAIYRLQIGRLAPDPYMLMFLDESARERRTSGRSYGYARRGYRCIQRRFFVRSTRFSILPVLTLDGIIAYDIIPGSVTSKKFVNFLRKHIVSPLLFFKLLL